MTITLKIEQKNGVYFLEGKINSTTLPFIKEFVKKDFKQHKTIEINIEKIRVIDVNGVEHTIKVKADSFENNHFINPEYIFDIDGKVISAKFTNGQACYMYSLHLIFMIYGTYLL